MTETDLVRPVSAQPARRPAAGRSPMPVLMCSVFMIVLDFFAVSVAIPSMQTGLHAPSSAIEWVVAGSSIFHTVNPPAAFEEMRRMAHDVTAVRV